MRTRLFRSFVLLLFVATAAPPVSAFVVNPGSEDVYIAGPTIPLPDVNAADAVVVGASIFVGQGAFGAGQQSIVRVDPDGSATTVVSNLNALGGLTYDVAGDRLLFTDNGGNLMGATSGDTVYALPSPRSVGAPIDAATLTLLPSGSIPFAQAVLVLPGGDVLVGDAAGPGSGRVVRLSAGVPTNFITGLDYVAGLSLNVTDPVLFPTQQIQVGNVDGSFVGSVKRYSLAGAPLGTINATPLSGALDQASDAAGNMYVTGGFTQDFSSSTLVHVVQAGAVEEVASGFGFSSGVTIDRPSQEILVLDFGVPRIDTLVDVLYLTAGGHGKNECQVEAWGSPYDLTRNRAPRQTWTCTDGDPNCDRDLVANGTCELALGACMRVSDHARLPKCTPVDVDTVTVTSKTLPAAASAVQTAVDAVLPATAATCSATSLVSVPADGKSRKIEFDAAAAGRRIDRDALKLRCLP
jgi:hypothetical protein